MVVAPRQFSYNAECCGGGFKAVLLQRCKQEARPELSRDTALGLQLPHGPQHGILQRKDMITKHQFALHVCLPPGP